MKSVLDFLAVLVRRNGESKSFVGFRDVLRSLIEPIYPQQLMKKPQRGTKIRSRDEAADILHKQAYHSTGGVLLTFSNFYQ